MNVEVKLKTLTICLYTDEFASGFAKDMADEKGMTAQDWEYQEMEDRISAAFPGRKINFERGVEFRTLKNRPFDFYVFDIGGMCKVDYGGERRRCWMQPVVESLGDHPNSGFVPWSMMTWKQARAGLEDLVLGDAKEVPDDFVALKPHNLFLPDPSDEWARSDMEMATEWMRKFLAGD